MEPGCEINPSTVNVALPLNLEREERSLFEPYGTYHLPGLQVKYPKEVFVTHSGLCVNDQGLMKESHHDYPEKYNDLQDELAYYFKIADSDPSKLIELDDDNIYLIICHPWSGNYWHWMTEAILRAWMVRHQSQDMVLILPEKFRSAEFVESSLKPFSFRSVYFVPSGKSLLIRRACLPQIKSIADSYYKNELEAIRQTYLLWAQEHPVSSIPFTDKIYISRKKSTKRKVENEEALEGLLITYGFTIVCNEDYSFVEQIQLYAQARYLVSIHGAGMTNMLFMREGTRVLELHKRKTNDRDWHSFAFWYMADALGFSYMHQLCDPVDPRAHFFEADFKIDMDLLEKNIRLLLRS